MNSYFSDKYPDVNAENLIKMFKEHDFYFIFSDDPSNYQRGNINSNYIDKFLDELSEEDVHMAIDNVREKENGIQCFSHNHKVSSYFENVLT